MKMIGVLLGCLSLFGALATADRLWATEPSVPAQLSPGSIAIVPPSQQLPERIRRCSGVWGGRLELMNIYAPPGRGTDVTIYVKEINATGTSAKIIYSWANSSWDPKNGSEECVADISYESEATILSFAQNGRTCVLRSKSDGEIVLWRYNPPYKLLATMKKIL